MSEIGRAYGNALFLLAHEENIDGDILEEITGVCSIIDQNPDYTDLMTTPNLKKAKRLEILSEAFEGRVHDYLFNFMCILVERNGFEELGGACAEYHRLYNEAHGILEVTAVTAIPLTDEQKKALAKSIEKAAGKTVELKNRVDASCIGGVRLETEGKSIDGSVKSRLEAIRRSLLSAKA